MSTITELKDAIHTKTSNFVLLTIATAGIYPMIWLFLNTQKLEKITSKKIANNTFLILLVACIEYGVCLQDIADGNEILYLIGKLVLLVGWGLQIAWAFRAKAALQEYAFTEHKTDLRMNALYTFFLTVYYINYCINDLAEVQRRQQILTGQKAAPESQQKPSSDSPSNEPPSFG